MTRLARLLALRHLRRHPLRAVLAVVGVAAGTALAVSVLVVQSSVSASVEAFGRTLSGPTELRVVGAVRRGGLEPDVVRAVAATEGVGSAIPLIQGVSIVAPAGEPASGSGPGPTTSATTGTAAADDIAGFGPGSRGEHLDQGLAGGDEPGDEGGGEQAGGGAEGEEPGGEGAGPGGEGSGSEAEGVGGGDEPGGEEEVALVLGVDCRVEALVGEFGCTDELVAGDGPLLVGPGVDRSGLLRTHGLPVPLRGAPTAPADAPGDAPAAHGPAGALGDLAGGDLAGGDVVVFGLEAAQQMFGRGDRVDVVYVTPAPGADVGELRERLEAAVGDRGGVQDADDGPPEVELALADVLPLFTLLALLALGTGAMLVYNTASLSVEERRHDLAVVAALGGTPGVVATTTLTEALVVGAVGGGLGGLGGMVVAGPIVATLSTYTHRVAGIPLTVHAEPAVLVTGLLLGATLSLVATWVPVRRAVRADTAAELAGRSRRAESSAPVSLRRAGAWGLVGLAGLGLVRLGNRGGGLEPWQVPAAGLGFGLMAVGVLLAGAGLAAPALRPLGRLVRPFAAPRLAVANLVREPRRTGVMVAAVGAAVTTAFVTAGYGNSVQVVLGDSVLDNTEGVSVRAVGVGANVNLDTGLAPAQVEALAGLEAVAEVKGGSSVLVGVDADELMSVVAYEDPWFEDGEEGLRGTYDRAAFEDGEAIINSTLARDEGLRPGDTVGLPTPAGVVEVPIQVVSGSGGASGRVVQVPCDLHRELYGPQPRRAVQVVPAPGVTTEELVAAIEVAGLGRSAIVHTPEQVVAETAETIDGQLASFRTLQRGLLAVSFVAVLSTLLLVGVQRRREFGVLGALGTGPAALGRMVVAEAGAVGTVAIAFGALGGLVMLYAVVLVGPLLIGWRTVFAPAWADYVPAAAVALVVTVVAGLWPARRAARTDVVTALRDE